jgi:hypothetical protein
MDLVQRLNVHQIRGQSEPKHHSENGQGPGGYNYGGFNIFGVLYCAAAKDPSDPACWGTKLSFTGGAFQGSWSLDAYAKAAENPPSLTGGAIASRSSGSADPLDPSQLINLKPAPNPAATSRAYVCTAIQGAILQLRPSQGGGLAALQTMYRKSCQ